MLIVYTYVIKTFYNFHPLSKYKDIDKNIEAHAVKFGEIRLRTFLWFPHFYSKLFWKLKW